MEEISKIINYSFNNINILKEALTHPSINGHQNPRSKMINYQRLEFLGDNVLSMVISEMIFNLFPNDQEGSLAKKKIALTCGTKLARISQNISLGQFIIMTQSERNSGGETNLNNLENTLEALIGAIYLDGGIEEVKKFIYKHWYSCAKEMLVPPQDEKTTLQELAQSQGLPIPSYTISNKVGPAHKPIFTIKLSVFKHGTVYASGNNKRLAEQEAAKIMLQQIYQNSIKNEKK